MKEFIFNCHTHVGDAFIVLGKKRWTVEELVAPPGGLKHRLLRKASESDITGGMEQAVSIMKKCGTTHFCDFREGGVEGVKQLREVAKGINAIVLGRPLELNYDKKEMNEILKVADGVGLSSISDWEYEELKKVAGHANKKKKLFAIHASEALREDINAILELKPSFLVHMSSASSDDLELVADASVPVVVCPRSNAFFGIRPDIEGMIKYGIPLLLGTDNAMITPPDITEEMKYLLKNFNVAKSQALEMINTNPRKYLNVSPSIQQSDGRSV
ncbi:MAG: amidohydrolase family protein [Candidatus Thermoplasmatota archaeon]|nr:amidohydrolase family protein [Candidatus Thermoplasmatota archaeon]